MWITDLLGGIASGISSIVSGWQTRQTARVEAEVQVIKAKAEAEATIAVAQATAAQRMAEQAQAADAQWDMLVAQQMDHTWKDEWYVLLFSIPLILAFCGDWGANIVRAGFAALNDMPGWYYYSIGTMLAATFGMRRLLSLFERLKGGK